MENKRSIQMTNEQKEREMVSGLYPKEPSVHFVKATFGIKKEEFVDWFREKIKDEGSWKKDERGDHWINIDILESKGGKLYAVVNNFQPKKKSDYNDTSIVDDEITSLGDSVKDHSPHKDIPF